MFSIQLKMNPNPRIQLSEHLLFRAVHAAHRKGGRHSLGGASPRNGLLHVGQSLGNGQKLLPEIPAPPPRLSLRILQTTDLHGALTGYDYLADRPSTTRGLTRLANLIARARAGAANSLLFDTGDFLQGSPLTDRFAELPLPPDRPHPVIAAMNALGYDAVTPGNHDFSFGAGFLTCVLGAARFAVTSANFLAAAPDAPPRPVFPPYVILTRRMTDDAGAPHDLRIAVIGCLPPQSLVWEPDLAPEFDVADMAASVAREVSAARTAGADLVVVLGHTGIDTDPAGSPRPSENTLIALAAIPGVDALLGGHTHTVFPEAGDAPENTPPPHPALDSAQGRIGTVPTVMAGFAGNHLGQIDLALERDANGRWHVAAAQSRALPLARPGTPPVPEEPALAALLARDHAETLAHIRQPVGETRTPLHSFFSLIAPDASVQLVARAQESYLAREIEGTPLAALAVLSAASPFKTGRRSGAEHFTHVPAGPLTRRSLADLYLYPNRFCAVRLTGAALRIWLEHAVSVYSHIPAGSRDDRPLLACSFPGYKFEIVRGLTYEVDLSVPPRFDGKSQLLGPHTRIRNLRWRDRPLDDAQEFLLVTNNYRANSLGLALAGLDGANRPEVVLQRAVPTRDILRDYLRAATPIAPRIAPMWRFAPLGGATALYQTSPQARAYLGDPGLPALEDLGDTPDGFARFRVTL